MSQTAIHSLMTARLQLYTGLLSLILVAPACRTPPSATSGVEITALPDRLRIELCGHLFTEYFFTNVPRPYLYPVVGPAGIPLTRNWPMNQPPDEERDHPHHRSLWFAHGLVNGRDFWSDTAGSGRIVHEGFDEVLSGRKMGVVRSRNRWVDASGKVVCTDRRAMKFYNTDQDTERVIDFEITLMATHGSVTFGDTKEGSMAMRLGETIRLKHSPGQARIVTSEGARDTGAWGTRAPWCDYSGPAEGRIVGVAIFDHPRNPRHPTWWHVRDYGLFAANPFGKHDFDKLPDKNAGDFTITSGKSATFRYRFYLHLGDEKEAEVAAQYERYAGLRR